MTASTPEAGPPPPHEAIVAVNVRRLREAARLSQAELAARVTASGYAFGEMAAWGVENNRRRVNVEDLHALAGVLGVGAAELLEPNAGVGARPLLYEIAFVGGAKTVEADTQETSGGWVHFYLRGELVYFASAARLHGVRVKRDGEAS